MGSSQTKNEANGGVATNNSAIKFNVNFNLIKDGYVSIYPNTITDEYYIDLLDSLDFLPKTSKFTLIFLKSPPPNKLKLAEIFQEIKLTDLYIVSSHVVSHSTDRLILKRASETYIMPITIDFTGNDKTADLIIKDGKITSGIFGTKPLSSMLFVKNKAEYTVPPNDIYEFSTTRLSVNKLALETQVYFVVCKAQLLLNMLNHLYTICNRNNICVVYKTSEMKNGTEKAYFEEAFKLLIEKLSIMGVKTDYCCVLFGDVKITNVVSFRTFQISLTDANKYDFRAIDSTSQIIPSIKTNGLQFGRYINSSAVVDYSIEIFDKLPTAIFTSQFSFDFVLVRITINQIKLAAIVLDKNVVFSKFFIFILDGFELDEVITADIKKKNATLKYVKTPNISCIHNLPDSWVDGASIFKDSQFRISIDGKSNGYTGCEIKLQGSKTFNIFNKPNPVTVCPILNTNLVVPEAYYFSKPFLYVPPSIDLENILVMVASNPLDGILWTFLRQLDYRKYKFVFLSNTKTTFSIPDNMYTKSLVGTCTVYYNIPEKDVALSPQIDSFVVKHQTNTLTVGIKIDADLKVFYDDKTSGVTQFSNYSFTLKKVNYAEYFTEGYIIPQPLETSLVLLTPKEYQEPVLAPNWTNIASNQSKKHLWMVRCKDEKSIEMHNTSISRYYQTNSSSTNLTSILVFKGKLDAKYNAKYTTDYSVIIYASPGVTITVLNNVLTFTQDGMPDTKISTTLSNPPIDNLLEMTYMRDSSDVENINAPKSLKIKYYTETNSPFTTKEKYILVEYNISGHSQPQAQIFNNQHKPCIVLIKGYIMDIVNWLGSIIDDDIEREYLCIVIKYFDAVNIKNLENVVKSSILKYYIHIPTEESSILSNSPIGYIENKFTFIQQTFGIWYKKNDSVIDNSQTLGIEVSKNLFINNESTQIIIKDEQYLKISKCFLVSQVEKITVENMFPDFEFTNHVVFLTNILEDELRRLADVVPKDYPGIIICQTNSDSINIQNGRTFLNFVILNTEKRTSMVSKSKYTRVEVTNKLSSDFFKFGIWNADQVYSKSDGNVATEQLDFIFNRTEGDKYYGKYLVDYATRTGVVSNFVEFKNVDESIFPITSDFIKNGSNSMVFIPNIGPNFKSTIAIPEGKLGYIILYYPKKILEFAQLAHAYFGAPVLIYGDSLLYKNILNKPLRSFETANIIFSTGAFSLLDDAQGDMTMLMHPKPDENYETKTTFSYAEGYPKISKVSDTLNGGDISYSRSASRLDFSSLVYASAESKIQILNDEMSIRYVYVK